MTQDNKQLVTQFLAGFNTLDIQGILDQMADDATWLNPGKPEQMPSAGSYDKARLQRLFERMRDKLDGPLQMTITSMIAEGDRVAVEAEGRAHLKNGRNYAQQYHFWMECRAGKIACVREYLDTQHAHDTWFRP
jgi:ketosteroid isomerase-like protein